MAMLPLRTDWLDDFIVIIVVVNESPNPESRDGG